MNAERLLRLADHLETVVANLPPERFDMGGWGYWTKCGTACCGIGHAASIPEFYNAGFYLLKERGYDSLYPALDRVRTDSYSVGWDAVEVFFDLDQKEAYSLFTSDDPHIKPVDVAARIRDFVRMAT